jgi:creatinine amidohydrolase/Fe(II)-dependent formamide hydrolase-like protein
MSLEKKDLWWQYLSWPEIVERAKRCDIALFPMGSIEQHGPHLPTGHDTLQLFKIGEAVAERTGAILLPCPWYGAHPYHHWHFPGTLPLKIDTCRELVKDVVRGAANAGYNKFIIFWGHGQAFALDPAVHDLGLEGYFVISVMLWNLVKDIHSEVFEDPFWHADEAETSIGLYTHPEFVDMSKAAKESPTTFVDGRFVEGPSDKKGSFAGEFWQGTWAAPEYKDLKKGIIGDATKATREKGERYVTKVIERFIELVEHIKARYPVGVKPQVK